MLETIFVLAILLLLVGGAVVTAYVSWVELILGGAALVALGTLVGVPTGVWYHVRLHAHLAPRGELPPRWWVSPARHHDKLREEERPDVLRWFFVGGVGFMVIVLGCVVVALGVLLQP